MFRLRFALPATVALAAFVAACAGAASTPQPTAVPATAAPPSATPPVTLAYTVSLAPAGFFVGPTGHTLYTFDTDTLGTSNCQASQCASNWPALTLQGGVQLAIGAGLTQTDFATITREDGTAQVTFKDIPLYYFAGDQAVGDKNGDGVGGIWHLATKASVLPVASSAPSAPASAPATAPASSAAIGGPCYDAHYQVVPCPTASSAASSPAAGGSTVSVSGAGYLVGPTGLALYEYDKDATANSSACTGDCLSNWPALTVAIGESVVVGTGIDQEDFAVFTRSDDGTSQVTYYGKPLYMFAADSAAGDTNGASVSPSWHLAMPQ